MGGDERDLVGIGLGSGAECWNLGWKAGSGTDIGICHECWDLGLVPGSGRNARMRDRCLSDDRMYEAHDRAPLAVRYGIKYLLNLLGFTDRHLECEMGSGMRCVVGSGMGCWMGSGMRCGVGSEMSGIWDEVRGGIWGGVRDGMRCGVGSGMRCGVGSGMRCGVGSGVRCGIVAETEPVPYFKSDLQTPLPDPPCQILLSKSTRPVHAWIGWEERRASKLRATPCMSVMNCSHIFHLPN